MAEVPGSAQDSGVETEGDQESNDSSMSSVSVGVPQQQLLPQPQQPQPLQLPQQPQASASDSLEAVPDFFAHPVNGLSGNGLFMAAAAPEPSTSGLQASVSVPLASSSSIAEDGYLGDCSSDGGNEKNFPMPPDTLKRLTSKRCSCHPAEEIFPPPAAPLRPPLPDPPLDGDADADDDAIEPPAGIGFRNVQPEFFASSCGYQVLLNPSEFDGRSGASSNPSSSRKMRSSIKSRFLHHHAGNWSHLKASIVERKIRLAANTNNTETLTRLLESGVADVNVGDEHRRTALHFAAAKGYAEVVRLLLQHGADPNRKDALGNTALHLAACTNHIEVVTLLLRAGTNVATLDNNGRTPMQLAQSKLKLLQKHSNVSSSEMAKVKTEVAQVLEMMREYLMKTGHDYNDLLNSFSHRLTLHQTHDDLNSDLQSLLDSLGNLTLKKEV